MKVKRSDFGIVGKKGFQSRFSGLAGISLSVFLILGFFGLSAVKAQEVRRLGMDSSRIYRMAVPANAHWTDTGFDVKSGQEIYFNADGAISLQQGNPVAFPCGPQGLEIFTVQQPLQDQNIGALIGRVYLLISIEVDEETGEETRNEMMKEFFIGRGGRIEIPMDGQLFLGINELIVEDNAGEFRVEMQILDSSRTELPY